MKKKIYNFFKKKNSIPLDEFIKIALYDKNFGYYVKNNPIGKNGNFITAPIISNLFAEMITIWMISFWEHLGKPKKFILCELGPGDGTLCNKLLSTSKNFKKFYDVLKIKLIEKSTFLKKIQKSNIKNNKVEWVSGVNKINNEPIFF